MPLSCIKIDLDEKNNWSIRNKGFQCIHLNEFTEKYII